MMQGILVACVIVTSSALKIQQSTNTQGGCEVMCKCTKSQFSFIFAMLGNTRADKKELEEAKKVLVETQSALAIAEGKQTTPTVKKEKSVFEILTGALSNEQSAPALKELITGLQKKIQQLEEKTSTQEGQEIGTNECCTAKKFAARDCAPGWEADNEDDEDGEDDKDDMEGPGAEAGPEALSATFDKFLPAETNTPDAAPAIVPFAAPAAPAAPSAGESMIKKLEAQLAAAQAASAAAAAAQEAAELEKNDAEAKASALNGKK